MGKSDAGIGRNRNDLVPPMLGVETKERIMTAALATAFFLSVSWLVLVAIAATFEGRGRRLRDVLAGRLPAAITPVVARFSPRYPVRRPQRVTVRPRLRAAA